jgi:lysophospholipase L1-like esterase
VRNTLFSLVLLVFYGNGLAQKIDLTEPVRFLALGDSYTIGQSVPASESWPVQFVNSLADEGYTVGGIKIIAQTGWRTDNLSNAVKSQMPITGYNLVSLLIGVNNQFQGGAIDTYAAEFEDLLKTAISLAGNSSSHVFVLSIPDYAYTPFGGGNSSISGQIDLFNSVNKRISDQYGVAYIDITPISRNGLKYSDLIASDGLHPSGKMYALWVNEILGNVERGSGLDEKPDFTESVSINFSQGSLSITTSFREAELDIFSDSGKRVKSVRVFGHGETRVPLGWLPSGIYFIRLQSAHRLVFTKKILIGP